MPTGDPNCLPYIRYAKQIYYKIVQATDGLTGGSDGDIGEKADENKMHGGGGADNDDDVDDKDEEEEESDNTRQLAVLLLHFNSNTSFSTDDQEPSESAEAFIQGGSCLDAAAVASV